MTKIKMKEIVAEWNRSIGEEIETQNNLKKIWKNLQRS